MGFCLATWITICSNRDGLSSFNLSISEICESSFFSRSTGGKPSCRSTSAALKRQQFLIARVPFFGFFQDGFRFFEFAVLQQRLGPQFERVRRMRVDFQRLASRFVGFFPVIILNGGPAHRDMQFRRMRVDRQPLLQFRNALCPVVLFEQQFPGQQQRPPAVRVRFQGVGTERIQREIENLRHAFPAGISHGTFRDDQQRLGVGRLRRGCKTGRTSGSLPRLSPPRRFPSRDGPESTGPTVHPEILSARHRRCSVPRPNCRGGIAVPPACCEHGNPRGIPARHRSGPSRRRPSDRWRGKSRARPTAISGVETLPSINSS